MYIGTQIRKIRKLKKISLTELSETSGVQIATLSRIENNKMTGTLDSHFQIAKTLGIDITELYQGLQNEGQKAVEVEEKFEITQSPSDKISSEILTRQVSSKRMLPSLIRIAGKSMTSTDKGPLGSEKFLFVLEGTVNVHILDQVVKLTQNTSLYIKAANPHSIENPLAKSAKVLSVSTPVTL